MLFCDRCQEGACFSTEGGKTGAFFRAKIQTRRLSARRGGGGKGLVDSTKKTLEHPKIGEKTVKISGMHCDHCVGSVAAAINKIDGAAAKVNLKKEEAVVSYDRQISDDEIRNAVEDAGFTVVSIR